MTTDYKHLRSLALAATRGPWSVSDDDKFSPIVVESPSIDICTLDTYSQRPSDRANDARYIAALSPEVVVGLLDRLEGLERVIAINLPHPNGPRDTTPGDPDAWNDAMWALGKVREERDEARQRLAAVAAARDELATIAEDALTEVFSLDDSANISHMHRIATLRKAGGAK